MYRADMSVRYYERTMLELAILGLLKERPMHGYDLRKRLRSGGGGRLASLSYGSLYPALARLERSGAVREVEPVNQVPAEVIPLTGSLAGERAAFRARLAARAATAKTSARAAAGTRGRKVYELTERGEEMFASMLADSTEPGNDDKSFALRWSFARYLPREGRLRLLQLQARRVEERIASAEKMMSAPGAHLDRYERQIAEHTVDSLNRDLSWIESLIASEQAERVGSMAATTTETDVETDAS